jgi:hypothetical protein
MPQDARSGLACRGSSAWPVALRCMGAGPMIPMCDDQKNKARACSGYVPGQRAGQRLSQ